MTPLSYELFAKCFPAGKPDKLQAYYPEIVKTIAQFQITKVAEFFATVGHESGDFRYSEEIASGEAYESRVDLGNTAAIDGDGTKYKGRGPIQITGTDMYRRIGKILGLDLLTHPELLLQPQYGAASAGAFWQLKGIDKQPTFFHMQWLVNGIMKDTQLPNNWSDRVNRLKVCRLLLYGR